MCSTSGARAVWNSMSSIQEVGSNTDAQQVKHQLLHIYIRPLSQETEKDDTCNINGSNNSYFL